MKSHGMKMLHHAVCFLTALAGIHVGLMAMGYNVLHMGMLSGFAMPIEYLFGLAGVAGLVMWFMHTFFCDCSACGCGSRSMS